MCVAFVNACIACVVHGPGTENNVSKEKGVANGGDSGANDSSHTGHESLLELRPPEVPVWGHEIKEAIDAVRVQHFDIHIERRPPKKNILFASMPMSCNSRVMLFRRATLTE